MPLGYNKALAHHHRVALGEWPLSVDDHRTRDLDALFNHVNVAGYDGVEINQRFLRGRDYFPGAEPSLLTGRARRAAERAGSCIFGSTIFLQDDQLRQCGWLGKVDDEIRFGQDLGGEYVSFQISLHPNFVNTGGIYRLDEGYLSWCADRIVQLRTAAWNLGMNFYVETHIRHISEDPQAFARILEMAPCEVNGDLSHYLYRDITRGKWLKAIYENMGHTHVRVCRIHGDLAADVPDPSADWVSRNAVGEFDGLTWKLFKMMMLGLAGGLSSRTIVGESGSSHLVDSGLDLDAKLVPLLRAMACYADSEAQGIHLKVEMPDAFNPWIRPFSSVG